jgi:hypothetical protein
MTRKKKVKKKVRMRSRTRRNGKRFELVISNVLFTSVRISLFTHSLSSHRR